MDIETLNLKREFSRLNPQIAWSFKDATRHSTTLYSHSYHRYPAKFIPNIVEKLILENTKEDEIVFDPFGGCGTTLVESKRLNRRSIGYDINPVAHFIAQVKTTPIDPKKLAKKHEQLLINLNKEIKSNKQFNVLGPKIDYWYDKSIVPKLVHIYLAIKKIKNKKIKNFFLCAFSHILKNCSRWLMKSIKPTIDRYKITPEPVEIFQKHLRSMIKKNSDFFIELNKKNTLKTQVSLVRRDSTKKYRLQDSSIDLIITSPPYVTSYEYADLHQLTLLWFSYDKKDFKTWEKINSDFSSFRKKFVGTSSQQAKNGIFDSKIAANIVRNLSLVDKSLSKGVANYFIDMSASFAEMHRVLKKDKKICIVIGNTELKGIKILNAEVVTEQLLNLGFKKVKYIKREVSNKMITPWRDSKTGKFTGLKNRNKKRAYEYEYIIVMKK